jgi:Ni/Fe-hydrogenase 1 B-type cytochrome subunit
MALSAVSGFALLNDLLFIQQLSLSDLHLLTYQVIALFTLLHLPAVFAHDLSGTSSDISGMINGHRIFETGSDSSKQPAQTVELNNLLKTLKK